MKILNGAPSARIGELHQARQRLRNICILFAAILSVLFALLYKHLQQTLQHEALLRYQSEAMRYSDRIENDLYSLIQRENQRSFGEYGFFSVGSNPLLGSKSISPSPLSSLDSRNALPGLIGYFQYQSSQEITSPIIPAVNIDTLQHNPEVFGVTEVAQRAQIWNELLLMLPESDLEKLILESENSLENLRLEEVDIPQSQLLQANINSPLPAYTTAHTSAEVDQIKTIHLNMTDLQPHLLSSGKLAFIRYAESEESAYLQGFVLDPDQFFKRLIQRSTGRASLRENSGIQVAFESNQISLFPPPRDGFNSSPQDVFQSPTIHLLRFSRPFHSLTLQFHAIPTISGAGPQLISRLTALLAIALILGVYGFYRLGVSHLNLAKQRSNFVSAVTHELKTPLTSIRMYGEMLRSGWISEESKLSQYYDRIFFESERLSRLINNVLQLSKLSNQKNVLCENEYSAHELLDHLEKVIQPQIEQADFTLRRSESSTDLTEAHLLVDKDALEQIIVNFVDNAIKFCRDVSDKTIEFGIAAQENAMIFSVRDFGPGVPKEIEVKIFELFFRGEDELTRNTPGTGIGLAIVHELAHELGASVQYHKREPGSEFQLIFTEKTGRTI